MCCYKKGLNKQVAPFLFNICVPIYTYISVILQKINSCFIAIYPLAHYFNLSPAEFLFRITIDCYNGKKRYIVFD